MFHWINITPDWVITVVLSFLYNSFEKKSRPTNVKQKSLKTNVGVLWSTSNKLCAKIFL